MDPVELIKLLVCVVGISWGMYRGFHHQLLCFIGFSLGTDLVSVDLGPTLNGIQILGILHLPIAGRVLGALLPTRSGRTLIAGLSLLAVLAVLYGYLLPWPDTTLERPWTQRAEGRSLINLGATVSHTSAALYIASCMQMSKYRNRIGDYLLIGSTFASLGVLIEVVTHTDLFSMFASQGGDWAVSEGGRARGFNGEPRVSGSVAVTGILLLFRPELRRDALKAFLLALHVLAMVFTTSTLGLILLLVGTLALLVITRRIDLVVIPSIVVSVMLLAVSAWYGGSPFEMWQTYAGERYASREAAIDAATPAESLVQMLEVFDGSALNFFLHHPEHTLLGAGPGMISLPASGYVPAGPGQEIFGDRIDSIPHMGIIRLVSDSGLLGLALWVWHMLAVASALRKRATEPPLDASWHYCRVYFVVFAILFLFQIRPGWYAWLGVGLGAAIAQREGEQRARQAAKAKRQEQAKALQLESDSALVVATGQR